APSTRQVCPRWTGRLPTSVHASFETAEVGEELLALLVQRRRWLGVDVVEDPLRRRVLHGEDEFAQVGGELVGLCLDLFEERRVRSPVAGEVAPDPLDRVLQLPRLHLVRQ